MTTHPGLVRTRARTEQPTARRRGIRPLAVGAAVAGAVVSWTLITQEAGVDLRAPDFRGSGTAAVGLEQVVVVSALAGLAAWGLLAFLEWRTRRGRRLWLCLALLAFLLSLGGPLSGSGLTSADRGLLVALHAVVAAFLVPLLYLSSRPSVRTGQSSAGRKRR